MQHGYSVCTEGEQSRTGPFSPIVGSKEAEPAIPCLAPIQLNTFKAELGNELDGRSTMSPNPSPVPRLVRRFTGDNAEEGLVRASITVLGHKGLTAVARNASARVSVHTLSDGSSHSRLPSNALAMG
jgi:hypothetical protein